MSAVDASGCVLVPIERLRALEAIEAEMPARVELKHELFVMLHKIETKCEASSVFLHPLVEIEQ